MKELVGWKLQMGSYNLQLQAALFSFRYWEETFLLSDLPGVCMRSGGPVVGLDVCW